jgi:hypothetical protein
MYQLAVNNYSEVPFKIVDKDPGTVQEFFFLISGLYHDYCMCREDLPSPKDMLEEDRNFYPKSNETVNGFLDGMIHEMMHRRNTFLDDFIEVLPEDADTDSLADFLDGCWDDMKPYYEDEIRIALEVLGYAYKGEWGEVRNTYVIEVW